jgi:maleate isomerase
MRDSLGWRKTFGVIAPSTNTSVQPEFDAMRPPGVTNHFSRIRIPNMRIETDADFQALMDAIRGTIMEAVDSVMSAEPDYLVMGMSAETFWDGLEGSVELEKRIEARAGVPIAMGSDACRAALKAYGPSIKRIACITPYQPIGDRQVHRFFTDCGFEVVQVRGLKCRSPVAIAQVSEKELRDAILEVNDPSVEAIVQVGTNLAMARVAALAEFWLDKPVVAINTATYWWALRKNGIEDKIHGFGELLAKH